MRYALLILPPLLWSTMIVTGRAVIGEVPPAALTFWTWLVAALALLPFVLRELPAGYAIIRKECGLLFLYAALGVSAFQYLYYAGLERTDAINASLFSPMLPIMVSCVAWFTLSERLSLLQLIGVVLSVCGAIWIAVGGDLPRLTSLRFGDGDLFILAAFICMAFYTVMLRKFPSALSPALFMALISMFGALLVVPFYIVETGYDVQPGIPWRHAIAILYIGIVTYDLGYIFWNVSVKNVGANMTAVFLYLIPFFGTVLAILFLDEKFMLFHGIGIGLIFAGIYLCLHRGVQQA